ncbi:hypothetical protein [Rubripirellula reticaptiva]|nr:hypothetical protein [Rubripirellula reticaptiva]
MHRKELTFEPYHRAIDVLDLQRDKSTELGKATSQKRLAKR